jgi:hypothetical protein
VSLLQREAGTRDGSALGGAGAAACALPAVDAVLSAAGAVGAAQGRGLLSDVLTLFLRVVFALQRQRARRQGPRGGQVGAVSFIQFFGSALRVTPHFHLLVPDGVFAPGAKLWLFLFPQAGEEEVSAGKEAAVRTERMKQRTPRED